MNLAGWAFKGGEQRFLTDHRQQRRCCSSQHVVLRRTSQVNSTTAALVLAKISGGTWCPCLKWLAGQWPPLFSVFLITGTTMPCPKLVLKNHPLNECMARNCGSKGGITVWVRNTQKGELRWTRLWTPFKQEEECVPEIPRVCLPSSRYGILSHPLPFPSTSTLPSWSINWEPRDLVHSFLVSANCVCAC